MRISIAKVMCLSLFCLLLSVRVLAEPVPQAERVDIELRRTTLIVADIENSLRFYRDALGMRVIYDNMIRTPRSAQSDEEARISRRLVFVRANDDHIGIVGLLQYTKPVKQVRAPEPEDFATGSAVLLFNTGNVDERFAAASSVPGVEVLDPPTDVSYPSYDGKSVINVRVSTLRDPDGFLVELNQLLSELDK